MSLSLFAPYHWDDFETMFDKLVTDRYGPPNASKDGQDRKGVATGTSSVSTVFRPKMDVVENDNSIIMTTELPGAKKEDISVDLNNGRLTISGQTKSSNDHTEGSVRVSERIFGSFTRTVAVPPTVTPDQIKAAFTDGVLQVTIPKVKANNESQSIKIA